MTISFNYKLNRHAFMEEVLARHEADTPGPLDIAFLLDEVERLKEELAKSEKSLARELWRDG